MFHYAILYCSNGHYITIGWTFLTFVTVDVILQHLLSKGNLITARQNYYWTCKSLLCCWWKNYHPPILWMNIHFLDYTEAAIQSSFNQCCNTCPHLGCLFRGGGGRNIHSVNGAFNYLWIVCGEHYSPQAISWNLAPRHNFQAAMEINNAGFQLFLVGLLCIQLVSPLCESEFVFLPSDTTAHSLYNDCTV